jgi:nucleoside-diphosphate-sugar epimerase
MLTSSAHHYLDLDTRIIRPFNIYGPGMREDDTRVIPSFMRNKRDGKPLEVNGSGEGTRTFCYIDNFIEGIMRAMFFDRTNGEVFNLGTIEIITVLDLAKKISDKIKYVDSRVAEQKHRRPNIDKARKVLEWEPTISLKEGLEKTWKSYQ